MYLAHQQRKNPLSGKVETYWLIREHKGEAMALGFITKQEAEDLFAIEKGARTRARLLGEAPPRTGPGSLAARRPVATPVPTLLEWWGDTCSPWPTWPDCKMLQWLQAAGRKHKALRAWDDSRRVILRRLGHLRLDQVTVEVGDAFVVWMKSEGIAAQRGRPARGYSDRSCQLRIDHLQGSLDAAVEYGVLERAPKLHRPAVNDQREVPFHTPEQALALADELKRRRQAGYLDHVSLLAILANQTWGLRSGELLTRRWTDVDWNSAELRIGDVELPDGRWWRPKTERGRRTVPLTSPLLALFREEYFRQGRPDGWIFPQIEDPSKPRTEFRKALRSACKAARVPELHPHAQRHSAATTHAGTGATIGDLMKHFGWKTPEMAGRYVHGIDARVRSIVEASSPLSTHQPSHTSPESLDGAETGETGDHRRNVTKRGSG